MERSRTLGAVSARPHFHIAGIPIRIEPIFWVITAILGFRLQEPSLIAMWVAVVLVSILVHELGHAFALKIFGQNSSIVLHGFGGLTLSQRRLSRGQSIAVSLAGPLSALLLLGVPAVWADRVYGDDLWFDWATGGGGFGWYPALQFAVWVNIWWSVANLLPIRPLDGGNVMTEIVGIDKARIASVIFGAAAAVYAYLNFDGLQYAAFLAAFLAFINFSEYRRSRRGQLAPSAFDVDAPPPKGGGGVLPGHNAGPASRRPQPPSERGPHPSRRSVAPRHRPRDPDSHEAPVVPIANGMEPAAVEAMAWTMLRRGDGAGAQRLVQRASGGLSPFLVPTTKVAAGGDTDELRDAYLANPSGPSNLVPAAVVARSGMVLPLVQQLLSDGAAGRDAAGSIQTHLHYGEHFEHAAAAGEAIYAAGGTSRAQVAFDVAASWSKAGDADRALEWVRRAIADGFAAPNLLDGEPDLATVRQHPGWPEVRDLLT